MRTFFKNRPPWFHVEFNPPWNHGGRFLKKVLVFERIFSCESLGFGMEIIDLTDYVNVMVHVGVSRYTHPGTYSFRIDLLLMQQIINGRYQTS
jgi:hypothetical protein